MKPAPGPAPTEGGATEVLDVERASATPTPPRRAPRRRTPSPPPYSLPLASAQAWFLQAISHPGSVTAGTRAAELATGTSIDALLTSSGSLSATDRLGVYHFAYRARLIDALADDYPTLRYALGSPAFEALASRAIDRFPSKTPNLNAYGRVILEYLDGPHGRLPHRPFLRDLARLEWALVEVIHAPRPPRLSPDALRAIPLEAWPHLRFSGSASLRLLPSRWPVNRYLQAFRNGESPALPKPGESCTLVYRQGFTVWRMDLSPLTHGLLRALLAGVPLGEALEAVEGRAGADQVMRWFEAWVSGGVFAGVVGG